MTRSNERSDANDDAAYPTRPNPRDLSRRRFLGASLFGAGLALVPDGLLNGALALDTAASGVDGSEAGAGGATTRRGGEAFSVSAGRSAVLAVGRDAGGAAAVWRSADGANWKPVKIDRAQFQAAEVRGVVADGSGFVAVGSTVRPAPGFRRSSGPTVWQSSNGAEWSQRLDVPVAGNASLSAVAVAEQGVVAVGARLDAEGAEGEAGLVLHSEGDGVFSEVPFAPGSDLPVGSLLGVVAQGSTLVAVGTDINGGRVWQSADAREWNEVAAAAATFQATAIRSIVHREDGLYVTGASIFDYRPRHWRSVDGGATWDEQHLELGDLARPGAVINDLTALGRERGGVLVVGGHGDAAVLEKGALVGAD